MGRPFQQLRFSQLPELPARAHPYFEHELRVVEVDSQPFGRVAVRYVEHGDGPPLLLVHGLMTSSYSWRYVLEPLGRHFRLFAADLVGAGQSDKPDRHYGARALATFIGEMQEALGIRGCDVVGNSLGGYLCMWLALDDPGAMGRLVNIHSPGVPMARLYALKTALAMPGSQRLLSWLIGRNPLRWAHRNVHYWEEDLKSLEEARTYAAPLQTADGVRAFGRYLGQTLDPADMRRFVERLRAKAFPIPLQLLYARRDPMVPPFVGERLHQLLPDAEFRWLDECSHFAHVDRPQLMSDAIVSFLGER